MDIASVLMKAYP